MCIEKSLFLLLPQGLQKGGKYPFPGTAGNTGNSLENLVIPGNNW